MKPNQEVLSNPVPTIEVVYAGGTISALATPQGYREGGHVVDLVGQLGQHIPGFKDKITLGEAVVAYTGLSENIDRHYWEEIGRKIASALDRNPHAVVVTHGTDSMEQTARQLKANFIEQLRAKNAKIVLTGANDDVSNPSTDAWDNLGFAFDSASGEAEPGVYVAFHGKLIPADLVVKEPFDGTAMNFVSKHDVAYQQALHAQKERSQQLVRQLEAKYGKPQSTTGVVDYPVNVVRDSHQELLDFVSANDVRAILLTLYHSGTANTESPDVSVAQLAKYLISDRGITLFAVTENGEPVNFGGYETSVLLKEAGIIPLGGMLHDVALAKLQLIAPSLEAEQLRQEMQANRVGELT